MKGRESEGFGEQRESRRKLGQVIVVEMEGGDASGKDI